MKLVLKKYKLIFFTLGLLLIGSLYYLFFRQPILASSYFGIEFVHLELFTPTFNYLPSFIHQLTFILLTWLALNKSHMWFSIFFWLSINSLFELGQLLSKKDTSYLPNILQKYFQNGTYSHGDVIAIFLATFVAYIIIKKGKLNV